MDSTLSSVAYLGATILFILSLGGLSSPETSRRGNLYGMIGMAIAVLATVFGPQVSPAGIPWIVGAMAVSPDLLPICATSVALVGRRFNLAARSFGTLLIGIATTLFTAVFVCRMIFDLYLRWLESRRAGSISI